MKLKQGTNSSLSVDDIVAHTKLFMKICRPNTNVIKRFHYMFWRPPPTNNLNICKENYTPEK